MMIIFCGFPRKIVGRVGLRFDGLPIIIINIIKSDIFIGSIDCDCLLFGIEWGWILYNNGNFSII